MKLIVLTILTLLTTTLFSTEVLKKYRLYTKKGYVKVSFKNIDGILVDKVCAEHRDICLALKVDTSVQKNPQPVPGSKKLRGHPANDFCIQLGGEPKVLLDQSNNQYNFCEFSDGSLADSWHLYGKSKKKIKR